MQSIVNKIAESENIQSKDKMIQIVDKSGSRFIKNLHDSDVQASQSEEVFSKNLSTIGTRSNLKGDSQNGAHNQIYSSDELNEVQKKFIKEIRDIITSNNDLASISNKLEDVNEKASDQLESQERLRVIVAATSVANASMQYWTNNFDEWKKAVAEAKGVNPKESSAATSDAVDPGAIADSDVEGAVAGAVGSAITGCAQLTGGACAAAGATAGGVGASAGRAVLEVVDYFW